MREILKPGLILLIITMVTAALLGIVSSVTTEPIRANREKADMKAMEAVLPDFENPRFNEKTDADGYSSVNYYYEAYDGEDESVSAYVISVTENGFGGAIEMFVGIDRDGIITGVEIVSHDETAGLGANATKDKFKNQYAGKSGLFTVTKNGAKSENDVDAITSATITSDAVTRGVNNAIKFYAEALAKGGADK